MGINLWYAHKMAIKWLLTTLPEMWVTVRTYDERGWPTFEHAASDIITSSHMVLDLGFWCTSLQHKADLSSYMEVCHVCSKGRSPPMHPAAFKEVLSGKVFTSKGDHDVVTAKYEEL